MSKSPKEKGIAELFGLGTTSYLSENYFIEMPPRKKNGNFKNNAFTTEPEHVCNELIKLSFMKQDDQVPVLTEAK